MTDSVEVQVTIKCRPGVTREQIIQVMKELTFEEGLCYLNEIVESLQFTGDPVEYLND